MEVANVELAFWDILACCSSWAEVGREGQTLDLPLDLVQRSHLLCEHLQQIHVCFERSSHHAETGLSGLTVTF